MARKKKKNKLTGRVHHQGDNSLQPKAKPNLQWGTDVEDYSQLYQPSATQTAIQSGAPGVIDGLAKALNFAPGVGQIAGGVLTGAMALINRRKQKKAQDAAVKLMNQRKENLGNVKFTQNDTEDLPTFEFAKGGRIKGSPGVYANGGTLEPVSDEAVQVKADNPEAIDSVDIGPAFVDHNEIIDNKNRVFSDSHKLPSGMSIAKKAKQLEKMKSDNPRFSQSNDLVDSKLNNLYDYQSKLNQRKAKKEAMADGGTIHIKPENKGKFTAYAKSHGKGVQEMASQVMANKEDYSSAIVKRANFAKNAAKFKHQYGGDLIAQDATAIVKPLNKTAFLQPKANPFVDEMTVRKLAGSNPKLLPNWANPDRAWMGDGSKFINDAGNLETKPTYQKKNAKQRFQWGTEDQMDLLDSFNPGAKRVNLDMGDPSTSANASFLPDMSGSSSTTPQKRKFDWGAAGDTAMGFATTLGTFLPDIANLRDISRMPTPEQPITESRVSLDRVTPDAQFARINRATRDAAKNIRSNTAQSASANASMANLLSRKLEAENAARAATNQQNTEIQSREAALNVGVKARNAASANEYLQNVTQRGLAQIQSRSQSRANIAEKVLGLGRERNQMKLDRKRMALLAKKYEDSGVFNRQLLDILLKRQ